MYILNILAAFSLILWCADGLQLPKPKGNYDVGTTTLQLTDSSRLDPFAPAPQNRTVQISLHYPTCNSASLPFSTYLPPLTAANLEKQLAVPAGTLHNISTYEFLDAPMFEDELTFPVVLFSPGFGVSRLLYTTFVQDLASEGYIVVTIDHPYDASIVELSDGRVITSNISDTPESINLAVAVRMGDASFVLDELSTGNNINIPELDMGVDVTSVGFFGHSLGGASAAATMTLDDRIIAGVNMDGYFFGPDVRRGLSNPFMIMASEGHNRTTDPSWGEVWPKLRGFKREIEINATLHLTFTDGPILTDLFGVKLDVSFGTIAPKRFDAIQHAYLKAFFDFTLKGLKEPLLDGPSGEFPEVSFASE